jgi:hypothetical protein
MISFPTSPAISDTYSYNGNTWVWNGAAWDKVIGISHNWAFIGYVYTLSALPQTINSTFVQLTHL